MLPKSLQALTRYFTTFPGVGPRMASRYAFFLLHQDHQKINDFIKELQNLKKVRFCTQCFAPFDPVDKSDKLCPICKDKNRNHRLLCLVEKESDLYSLEETGTYHGLYFIIGSASQWFERKDSSERLKQLLIRIKKASPPLEEVILAINYTAEGQALHSFLQESLKKFPLKVTHLRQGLPLGSELGYADPETLKKALQGRE